MTTSDAPPLVIVSHGLPDEWLASLNGRCARVTVPHTGHGLAGAPMNQLAAAAGLLALLTDRVDDALLARAPRLRVVSNMAVGVDNIDLAACTRRGIAVGHTPGVLTESTADLTLALLLAAVRRVLEAATDAREGRWTTWTPTGWLGRDLSGATLGIVGLGKIGRAVAGRARAFGLRLVYASRKSYPEVETELGATRLPLRELLKQSDIVSLHVPLTPETHHLINAQALRLMKPTALLINAARGAVVDTAALQQALQQGWIAGAALDVTDPEPLPATHPLYRLPNCLIAPHIGSATHGTRRRMAERACENILAGIEGRRLPYCANPEVYA